MGVLKEKQEKKEERHFAVVRVLVMNFDKFKWQFSITKTTKIHKDTICLVNTIAGKK